MSRPLAPTTSHRGPRSVWPALSAWAVVFAVAAAVALSVADTAGLDLVVYQGGGRAVLDRSIDLYAGVPGTGLPFTYPTFAAVLFAPLALLPHAVCYGLIVAASAALMHLVSLDLTGRLRARLPHWPVPAWVLTVLVLLSTPGRDTLAYGQVNILLLAPIYLALARSRRRWLWFAVAVGVAAGIKLTPAALMLMPLVLGRIRACLVSAAVFMGTQLVGLLVLPRSTVEYWGTVLWDPSRVGALDFTDNASLRGALARLGDDLGAVWAVGALAVIVLAALVIHRHRQADPVLLLGVVSTVPLLVSPVSWMHHFVWWPVFLYAVLVLTRGQRGLQAAALVVGLPTLGSLVQSAKHLAGQLDVPGGLAVLQSVTPVGMVALLIVLLFARPRPDDV